MVTGCSSGIGRAVAQELLGNGWRVTGLSRRRPELTGDLTWRHADLSRTRELRSAVADVGPLRAVVHAAGFQRAQPLGGMQDEDLRGMLAVHVEAASALVDTLADRIEDGGRIVLIGSRTATGAAGKSQYAATKAALVGMSRSWAMELAPRRITVNVVAPGPTDTPMLHDPGRAAVPPAVPPLGELVDPRDVAALTGFLLGPHGRSLTGQVLTVCGGASL
ncbi:3-oxoacyl-ACP reductase [Kocuria sp. WN036]|nr:3-oxoacyl-ACP reductase [Kocuria sp. WN036]